MAVAWDTSVAPAIMTAIRTVGKQLRYTPRHVVGSAAAGLNDPKAALTEESESVLMWGVLTDFSTMRGEFDSTKQILCKGYLEPVAGIEVQVGDSLADNNRLFIIDAVKAEQPQTKVLVYIVNLVQR